MGLIMICSTGIYSIAKIEGEAKNAAIKHKNFNNSCPYPIDSIAGYIFINEFLQEKKRLTGENNESIIGKKYK